MRIYTGIGSRSTPDSILQLFRSVAFDLARDGWTLRSGCAPGADSAFEEGAFNYYLGGLGRRPKPELYLPWPRFEGRRDVLTTLSEPQHRAFEIAAKYHPAWSRLSQGARRLHARNVHQILGADLERPVPTRFVLCWTPEGAGGGGTGQALRIARDYDIEVIDAGSPEGLERVEAFLTRS